MRARVASVPFSRPSIGDAEIREVVATLESGWLTTGPRVREFEARFAAYTGADHAIAVRVPTLSGSLTRRFRFPSSLQ